MKSGSLAPAKMEELLTKDFDKRLWPGLYSVTGKKWLEQHKGSQVALLVAQCPQREANWQGTSGCATNKYMQDLVDTVRITLTRSIVIRSAVPCVSTLSANSLCTADGCSSPDDGLQHSLYQELFSVRRIQMYLRL